MSAGRIIVTPRIYGEGAAAIGNTCLYGATGGKLFAAGIAGERFAVRNSGSGGGRGDRRPRLRNT